MKKFLKSITNLLSRVTLVVYPYRLSQFVTRCCDVIASSRAAYLSGNHGNGKIVLSRPFRIMGHKYIEYKSLYSGHGLRLECIDRYHNQQFSPSVIFGENVSLNNRCHIGAINKIIIGDNVLIGSNVLITDHSHGFNDGSDTDIPPADRILYSKGPVVIENDVWIGENVAILAGVTIGRNSIIGANSVVTKNIPPYCIAAGNPATVIRKIPRGKRRE